MYKMKYNINQFRNQLSNIQSPERYHHSLGVMVTCLALAMRYQEDLEKAMVAGEQWGMDLQVILMKYME